MLSLYDTNTDFCIWACENRISDEIMIVLGKSHNKDSNGLFDEGTYNRAKYFSSDDYASAVDYVYRHIKYYFKDKMNVEKHYKFDLYRSINTLQLIKGDVSRHSYENYGILASLHDEVEQCSCDLVIHDGKLGLQYNVHDKNQLDSLCFKPCDINLENEATIMLDMKNNLNKFISDELNYSLEMNSDIKI